jgi:hypothetical protein
MSAEPPRQTIHVVQHLLLDGFRILRAQLPNEIGTDELNGALDAAIEQLSPIEGMPIRPNAARLYALASGLAAIVEEIQPYIATQPVDASRFGETLNRAREILLQKRTEEVAAMKAQS